MKQKIKINYNRPMHKMNFTTRQVGEKLTENTIPAVVYGKSIRENILIYIDSKQISRIFDRDRLVAKNHDFQFSIGEETYSTMIKGISYSPADNSVITHIDFFATPNGEYKYIVPVRLLNRDSSKSLNQNSYIFQKNRNIEVKTSKEKMVVSIDVDANYLKSGERVIMDPIENLTYEKKLLLCVDN